MPLYEYRLRIEQEAKKLAVLSGSRIDTGKTDVDDPKHDTEENQDPVETDERDMENNAKTVEVKQPLSFKDDLDRLKVQFGGLNTRVQGVETLLGDIDTKINLLVGQKPPPSTRARANRTHSSSGSPQGLPRAQAKDFSVTRSSLCRGRASDGIGRP